MKTNFIDYLFKHKYIEKFDTGFSEHLRLSTELTCYFNAEQIAFLKDEYLPELEKGGVVFIKPIFVSGLRTFKVEKIIFVTNRSETPHCSYRPDETELMNTREEAIKSNLLPFNFHSHPTKNDNILFENLNYYYQLNTSNADKIYRVTGIEIGETKLRLPDILIVANGQMKSGLFIGFYGGLVAPLDFKKRKAEVMKNFMQKNYEQIEDYFDTPKKKTIGVIGGVAAALGTIALFVKYPKAIVPSVLTTAAIVPSIAYSSSAENIFFGISHGQPLKIILPKLSDEQIIENEKIILQLIEEWRKNQNK